MAPRHDLPPKAVAAPRGVAAPKGVAAPRGVAAGDAPTWTPPDFPDPEPLLQPAPAPVATAPPVAAPPPRPAPAPLFPPPPSPIAAPAPAPPPAPAPAPAPAPTAPAPPGRRQRPEKPLQKRSGCARGFTIAWVIFVAITILGALAGDDESGEGTDVPTFSPEPALPLEASGVSGDTLFVSGYSVTVNTAFAQQTELGSNGYLVATVRVTGASELLPLARVGFTLANPDGSTRRPLFIGPEQEASSRIIWDIGATKGRYEVRWETPEITDDATASWEVVVE